MANKPPLPGIPTKHLPDRDNQPPVRSPSHVERGPDVVTPSMFSQLAGTIEDKKIARWKLIGGAITGLGVLVGSCTAGSVTIIEALKKPAPSATSQEVSQLQAELVAARRELSGSKVLELTMKIDDLSRRFDAWQEVREKESATNTKLERQLRLTAELAILQNGDKPARDWPEPDPRRWFSHHGSPGIRRTDQFWAP